MHNIIYSVKITVDKEIEKEWISFMKNHIEDVVNAGKFIDFNVRRNLNPSEKAAVDNTFIIEYHCENLEKLNHYFNNFASELQEEHNSLFKGQFQAERSIAVDDVKSFIKKDPINWDGIPSYVWPEYNLPS